GGRELRRLPALRLPGAVDADLDRGGEIRGELRRAVVAPPEDDRRHAGGLVELSGVGEAAQAGVAAVAAEAGGPPVAVALCRSVGIARRAAGAETLVHARGRDRHLIVDGWLQLIERGREILQGRGETLLLARHRIRVADPQQDVRLVPDLV